MKLKIEKLPHGDWRISLAPEGKAKPIVVTVTQAQLELVLHLVANARNAVVFSFEMEL